MSCPNLQAPWRVGSSPVVGAFLVSRYCLNTRNASNTDLQPTLQGACALTHPLKSKCRVSFTQHTQKMHCTHKEDALCAVKWIYHLLPPWSEIYTLIYQNLLPVVYTKGIYKHFYAQVHCHNCLKSAGLLKKNPKLTNEKPTNKKTHAH